MHRTVSGTTIWLQASSSSTTTSSSSAVYYHSKYSLAPIWYLQAKCKSGENSGEIAILSAGIPETRQTQCPSAPAEDSC